MLQLHKKYPLHNDVTVSFCRSNMEHMVGITCPYDPLSPFKKNSAFTKPLQEVLEEQTTPL
jgi:hypothetical protein